MSTIPVKSALRRSRRVRQGSTVLALFATAVAVVGLQSAPALAEPTAPSFTVQRSTPTPGDRFGETVVAAGEVVVVGPAGQASVLAVSGGAVQQQVLVPSSGTTSLFASALATDGLRVVVADRGYASFAGRLHVFERVGGTWTESATLMRPGNPVNLGGTVAIAGNRLAAGSDRGTQLWEWDGSSWVLGAFISSTPVMKVGLTPDGSQLIVTEFQAGETMRVYELGSGTPQLTATLPVKGDFALTNDTLVVGLPYATATGQLNVYRAPFDVIPESTIAADPSATFRFGEFVAISDGVIFTTYWVGGSSRVNAYSLTEPHAMLASVERSRGLGWSATPIAAANGTLWVGEYGNGLSVPGTLFGYAAPVVQPPDATPPTVTCRTGATVLPGRPVEVVADVSDTGSGPTAAVVRQRATAPSSLGTAAASVTGTDRAGNATTADCSFEVAPAVRIDQVPSNPQSYTAASLPVWFSADGELAAFPNAFVNVGQPDLPSDLGGLWLKNLVNGELRLVSTDSVGNPAELIASATLASNGRYAFFSTANNLGIRALFGPSPTPCAVRSCLYRKDLANGSTTLILSSPTNVTAITSSADGNRIAYRVGPELFWRDLSTNQSRWLNQLASGINFVDQGYFPTGFGNGSLEYVLRPMSADGRWILVDSTAQLVPADTDTRQDAYVIDALTGEARLLSNAANATISGREIAAAADVALVQIDYLTGSSDAVLVNVATGATTKVDVTPAGADVPSANGSSVTADASSVSFADPDSGRRLLWSSASGRSVVVQGPNSSLQPSQIASPGLGFVGASTASSGIFLMTYRAVDSESPVVTPRADRVPDSGTWYRSPVTIGWDAVDLVDGALTSPPSITVSTEGVAQTVTSAPVCDAAGNCASGSATISVDATAPTTTVTGVTPGATYGSNQVPTPTCSDTDTLSGVAIASSLTTTVTGTTRTATCAGAVDTAGNAGAPVSVTYTVSANPAATVVVLSSTGAAIAGIPVTFRTGSGATTNSTTGADGRASVLLAPGAYTVSVTVSRGTSSQALSVTISGANEVTFRTAAVTVTIVDPITSDLVAATVQHAGSSGSFGPRTAVNATGQVTFEALPGTSTFTAWVARGYQSKTITVTAAGPNSVVFETYPVTVTLQQSTGGNWTTGTVQHAGNSGSFGARTPIDTSGSVVFYALPGTSTFTAWVAGGYQSKTVTVSGTAPNTVNFQTIPITVTVLDQGGSPRTNATVQHAGSTGSFGPRTAVNAAGQVTFEALPGTSTLTAWVGSQYKSQTTTANTATSLTITL